MARATPSENGFRGHHHRRRRLRAAVCSAQGTGPRVSGAEALRAGGFGADRGLSACTRSSAGSGCDASGLAADRALRGGADGADTGAGRVHGARVQRRAGAPGPRPRPGRAPRLPRHARGPCAPAGLARLRAHDARLQRRLVRCAVPDPPHAGHPSVQPRGLRLRRRGTSRSTRRRRSSRTRTGSSTPARRRSRTSRRWPASTVQNFLSAAVGMAVLAAVIRGFASRGSGAARQLLARPRPHAALHPAAVLLRRSAVPRVAGGDPDPRADT